MRNFWIFIGFSVFVMKNQLMGCATCYGAADAPMTHGMNMGILSLLAVTGSVLGGISAFFIYIIKKSKKINQESLFNKRKNGSTYA